MIDNTDVRPLLDKLCIDLGFCLPPAESEKLFANPPETVLEFTNAVFSAEGLAPEVADRHLFRQVRDYVQQAFQCSEERQELLAHSRHAEGPSNELPQECISAYFRPFYEGRGFVGMSRIATTPAA